MFFAATLFSAQNTVSSAVHRADDFLKKVNSAGQLRQLASAQISDDGRKFFDASRSPSGKHFLSFDGRLDSCKPSIARVTDTLDKTRFLQAGDDPRHRGRLHLLRGGELAQGERPAEDDYRERGQARGR